MEQPLVQNVEHSINTPKKLRLKEKVAYGLGDWFDLGPKHPGNSQLTSNGVTATGMYYYNATIMSQIAVLLGEEKDKEYFMQLAACIRKAYNEKFYNLFICKVVHKKSL